MSASPEDFRLTAPRAARKWKPDFAHDDLQAAAVDFMRLNLPRDAIVLSIPNGGFRLKGEAARMKGCGLLAGAFDLLILWDARAFLIEIKTKTDSLSGDQVEFEGRCRRTGVPTAVARSLEQVEAALRRWSIPISGRVAA